MLQNAGFVFKNSQEERRVRIEIVAIYLHFNLYFRYNGVNIRVILSNKNNNLSYELVSL